jgi:adenylate cyclase
VGYTALTEAMGDESAADVAADFRRVVRALLTDYEAEEIKTIGDALLVRVRDPGAAVHLAARIESELGSTHKSLGVRVGLHTGSAVERDGDWFGSGVNLAARVAEQAQPGEVLMTAATAEGARHALVDGQVESRGTRELKNIPAPVELLALVPDAGRRERALPVDPVCRMAVDPALTPLSEVYGHVEYHFCSDACRLAFVDDPRRYIRVGART